MKQSASVLRFDPATRQSSRRRNQHARERRGHDRRLRLRLATDAKALGISVQALEADEGLYAHVDDVCAVEAAYGVSLAAGRHALIAAFRDYHAGGYIAGIDDGQATTVRAAVGR